MGVINDGGQAFPISVISPEGQLLFPGMTLRDYFAGQIAAGLTGYSGTYGLHQGPGEIVSRSYEVADAMISARSQEPSK